MTCIAAFIKGGEVWIGGDAVSVIHEQAARAGTQAKVFQVGEFLIGAAGTVRTQQIIRYLFTPPAITGDLTAYMVKQFVPGLRGLMKDNGGEVTEGGSSQMEARYLIGLRGRLFEIDSAYGVFESRAPYAAVGCADQEALAAMYTVNALQAGDAKPEEIVRRGLLAAAEFDTSIRPPFTILKLNA